MRENRSSGSEGGGQTNLPTLLSIQGATSFSMQATIDAPLTGYENTDAGRQPTRFSSSGMRWQRILASHLSCRNSRRKCAIGGKESA
jgi:hypothetical protein